MDADSIFLLIYLVPGLITLVGGLPLVWWINKVDNGQGYLTLIDILHIIGVALFPIGNMVGILFFGSWVVNLFLETYGGKKFLLGKKHYTDEEIDNLLKEIETLKEITNTKTETPLATNKPIKMYYDSDLIM